MTSVGRGAAGVGVLAITTGVIALVAAVASPIERARPAAVTSPHPSPSLPVRPYAADSLALVTVSRDLFRFDRRPARMVYDPTREASPTFSAPPKPVLVLVGIVAGARATAVIEGFPGVEGARVVRVGDEIGGLRVRSIGSREVLIAGMDTVWALRVREPWKD